MPTSANSPMPGKELAFEANYSNAKIWLVSCEGIFQYDLFGWSEMPRRRPRLSRKDREIIAWLDNESCTLPG